MELYVVYKIRRKFITKTGHPVVVLSNAIFSYINKQTKNHISSLHYQIDALYKFHRILISTCWHKYIDRVLRLAKLFNRAIQNVFMIYQSLMIKHYWFLCIYNNINNITNLWQIIISYLFPINLSPSSIKCQICQIIMFVFFFFHTCYFKISGVFIWF